MDKRSINQAQRIYAFGAAFTPRTSLAKGPKSVCRTLFCHSYIGTLPQHYPRALHYLAQLIQRASGVLFPNVLSTSAGQWLHALLSSLTTFLTIATRSHNLPDPRNLNIDPPHNHHPMPLPTIQILCPSSPRHRRPLRANLTLHRRECCGLTSSDCPKLLHQLLATPPSPNDFTHGLTWAPLLLPQSSPGPFRPIHLNAALRWAPRVA